MREPIQPWILDEPICRVQNVFYISDAKTERGKVEEPPRGSNLLVSSFMFVFRFIFGLVRNRPTKLSKGRWWGKLILSNATRWFQLFRLCSPNPFCFSCDEHKNGVSGDCGWPLTPFFRGVGTRSQLRPLRVCHKNKNNLPWDKMPTSPSDLHILKLIERLKIFIYLRLFSLSCFLISANTARNKYPLNVPLTTSSMLS